MRRFLEQPERKKKKNILNTLGKIREHLYGKEYLGALDACRERLNSIEVDRLRVKPIVKITGEFWAQTTEGDGNFNMFRFLEREGAQVLVEPIGTWIMYMLHQAKCKVQRPKGMDDGVRAARPSGTSFGKRVAIELDYRKKVLGLRIGEVAVRREYHHRVERRLGGIAHELVTSTNWSALASPFYNSLRRRRRGPPGSRQEHLLLEQRPGAHGAVAEAVRLHAVHAVRRRAVGGGQPTTRT